ncbi:hypothetical protein E3N88_14960 [Mikania micrantha]|uniref:Uncharacterized protein n=1 Tax=Mikania micrantha TaxID=192012 RepID=A0A5N6P2X9_9ASTR|nr:hypothetical protein E3N88_14960 [Mikania micrantha]
MDHNKNPEADDLAKIKDGLMQFENWIAKQCFPIEAALTTVTGAVAGAITGVYLDIVFHASCLSLSVPSPLKCRQLNRKIQKVSLFGGYQPLIRSFTVGPTLEHARNFAVMYAVNSGMCCVMKKLRGKFDVHACLAAGFSTGVVLSLVTGMRGPEVISVGVMFALVNGGVYKVEEKLGKKELAQLNVEDVLHEKPRDRSTKLDVQKEYNQLSPTAEVIAHRITNIHGGPKRRRSPQGEITSPPFRRSPSCKGPQLETSKPIKANPSLNTLAKQGPLPLSPAPNTANSKGRPGPQQA